MIDLHILGVKIYLKLVSNQVELNLQQNQKIKRAVQEQQQQTDNAATQLCQRQHLCLLLNILVTDTSTGCQHTPGPLKEIHHQYPLHFKLETREFKADFKTK
jgi:hypothetical protein